MTNNPLFSILIANYNNGLYLKTALQSVYSQTYKNWEIILVDDCSTDNSKELYKELEGNPRIKIYYNEKNQGCGYSKHRCAELANGEICGFLDPDDALADTALEETIKAHIDNPDASLIYSNCYRCDEQLNITNLPCYNKELPQDISLLEYNEPVVFHFATYKNVLYKKSAGIIPHIKRCVDYGLFISLEEVGKLLFLNKKLYFYRHQSYNSISTTTDSWNKVFMWQIMIDAEACKRRNLDIEKIVYKKFNNRIELIKRKAVDKIKFNELYPIYNSKELKLGKILLKPFKFIRKFF